MKKFLSMFAFAAAILFGTFVLASCGGKDDEIIDYANVKHTYTIVSEMYTSIQDPEIQKMVNELNTGMSNKIYDEFNKKLSEPMTSGEAAVVWMNIINMFDKANQDIADAALIDEEIKDPNFVLTIKMLEDGKEFKKKEYRPNPLLGM